MHHLKCHASSHVCALCHVIDCPSLFVVCLLLLDRRRRWYRRSLRLRFSGVSSTPDLSEQASIHSHEPLFPFLTCYGFFSLSYLLAVLFDACLDPITCHPAAMNIALPPHLQPCCLLACVVVSCLGLSVLESCCHLSYLLFSMIDGLVIINIMLIFGVTII